MTMILVTGATGFVGRRVVAALAAEGRSVRVLVHSASHAHALPDYQGDTVEGDVLSPASLEVACDGIEAVIHLAAVIRERRGASYQQINNQGTQNILAAADAAGVRKFVHASTVGATSDPDIPYLYSRWMAEQEVERSEIPHTIVRFSVGFGEGDEFFNTIAALVKVAPIVPVAGDGKALFQPIAVEDAARCLVATLDSEALVDQTIEAGGPVLLTYDEIVDLIAETLGAKIKKLHAPMGVMTAVATLLEAMTPRPPVTPGQLKMLRGNSTTDLASVETHFGFTPRSPRDNIDYIKRIGLVDAMKISLGFIPRNVRDH
jgi:uncharacterized protein YbjT (DUF2867 family)